MILSHIYRFIFLKTRKTAGTSVEISLSRYCGPLDIITPITPRDELIRWRMGIHPQNYIVPEHISPTGEVTEQDISEYLQTIRHNRKFYNHISAQEIRAEVGEQIWQSYYKFTIERDPRERAISQYYWEHQHNPQVDSLETFFRYKLYKHNFPIYSIADQVAVDGIINYDNLTAGLTQICNQLSLPFDGWLPDAKADIRLDRRGWQEILSIEQQSLIRREFWREFEVLETLAI